VRSEPDFGEYPEDQSEKEMIKQFIEHYKNQSEQIQSLSDTAIKTKSYFEVMTAIENFLGDLPPNVDSSTNYRSLFDAWKSALKKFIEDNKIGDVSAECIANTIKEAIEDYHSVLHIKMLNHAQQKEDDRAIKTAIKILKQIELQSEIRDNICIDLGTEIFLNRLTTQCEQIQDLFDKKFYSEAEAAIENFFKSLPSDVVSSTDRTSLENAWRFALDTFFQDFERGDVPPACINHLVTESINIFYHVLTIKLKFHIEQQEFDKKSDTAIKTGMKLLSLLPSSEHEKRFRTCLALGLAYSKQEKFDDALSWYEKASTIKPYDEYGWLNKGIVTSKKALRDDSPELFEQALNYFKETLTFIPNSIGAQVGLAFTKELVLKPREFRNKLISHEIEILDGGKGVINVSNKYLEKILNDMRRGLNIAMVMFIIQFFVGLFLIFLSVWLLVKGYDAAFNALIGGSGALISIVTLYKSAPFKIQKNRVDLAQWNIIFSNWANANYITNTLIAQKIRRGENDMEFTKAVNNYLKSITNDTVELIKKHLENGIIEEEKEITKFFENIGKN